MLQWPQKNTAEENNGHASNNSAHSNSAPDHVDDIQHQRNVAQIGGPPPELPVGGQAHNAAPGNTLNIPPITDQVGNLPQTAGAVPNDPAAISRNSTLYGDEVNNLLKIATKGRLFQRRKSRL